MELVTDVVSRTDVGGQMVALNVFLPSYMLDGRRRTLMTERDKPTILIMNLHITVVDILLHFP